VAADRPPLITIWNKVDAIILAIGLKLKVTSDMISLMKTVKYLRHARNRMRRHEISEAEVESTIENPEFMEPSIEGRINAWKEISAKFLRVTYKEETDGILVITAVKKRKGWG
jgi:hypothetical protein